VREIDALGGAMARAADRAGIQFRTLNASKGPAVRATRAQADRQLYKQAIRSLLENQPNLELFQQEVADLILESGRVRGVVTVTGITFQAPAVVLTVGTFLAGRMHVGLVNYPAAVRAMRPPTGSRRGCANWPCESGDSRPGPRRGSTAAPSIGRSWPLSRVMTPRPCSRSLGVLMSIRNK